MLYGLIHLFLLLAATLGVWTVRSRALLVAGALLLLPLPAALYNYLAVPVPDVVATLADPAATADCAGDTSVPGNASSTAGRDEERSDVKPDCGSPVEPPRQQILIVTLVVNYLTVFLGFLTGMLCRRAMATR